MNSHTKLLFALCLAVPTVEARADVFRDLAVGLGAAGFDIQGQRNHLNGGFDFLTTNTFTGEEFDFGTTDLTLNGPLSLSLSTGGRNLSEFELSFRTAVNATSGASPLQYVLNSDVGNQSAQINGSLLIDGNMTINGFGFYDLDLTYSSRQSINQDGVFADGNGTSDLDVGPINVSGNIYADILATLTDPLFQSTGTVNIFSQFSGRDQLRSILASETNTVQQSLAAESAVGLNPLATVASERSLSQVVSGLAPAFNDQTSLADAGIRVVPEPAVLLLMLLGAPLLIQRTWKRKVRS